MTALPQLLGGGFQPHHADHLVPRAITLRAPMGCMILFSLFFRKVAPLGRAITMDFALLAIAASTSGAFAAAIGGLAFAVVTTDFGSDTNRVAATVACASHRLSSLRAR